MQVEQEKHVERRQCAAQNETRSFTHSTGNQHSHLREKVRGGKGEKTYVQFVPNVLVHYENLIELFLIILINHYMPSQNKVYSLKAAEMQHVLQVYSSSLLKEEIIIKHCLRCTCVTI